MKAAIATLAFAACGGPTGQFCKEGSRVVFKEGLTGKHPNCVDINCPGDLVIHENVWECVAPPAGK